MATSATAPVLAPVALLEEDGVWAPDADVVLESDGPSVSEGAPVVSGAIDVGEVDVAASVEGFGEAWSARTWLKDC